MAAGKVDGGGEGGEGGGRESHLFSPISLGYTTLILCLPSYSVGISSASQEIEVNAEPTILISCTTAVLKTLGRLMVVTYSAVS
jgi:hypothetical protein